MFTKMKKCGLIFFRKVFSRNYTSRAKRSVLLQNKEKFTEHEYRKLPSNRERVYVWGFAETGALGVQTSIKKATERHTAIVHHPTRMKFADHYDVTDVAAGYGFSAFAVKSSTEETTLFGTGINSDSQIGFQEKGRIEDKKQLDLIIYPTPINLPKNFDETNKDLHVRCMSAGRAHLVVITKNGTIFALGNNSYGQCGRKIIKNEIYRGSNIVNRIDKNSLLKNDDDDIVSVSCGQDHTLFVTKTGKVLSCGWGSDGQTGRGSFSTTGDVDFVNGDIEGERIIKVASSADCVLALNDKGEVFGWGNSEYGQLDTKHNGVQFNLPTRLDFTKGYGKIVDIAAGGSFCVMLNDEGDVFTWGYGILGFGPFVDQTSKPTKIVPVLFGRNDFNVNCRVEQIHSGVFHMAAINSDGDLFMWGKNRFGCLGLGHTKDQFYPFKTAVNAKVKKISCGVDHTLAICKPFI